MIAKIVLFFALLNPFHHKPKTIVTLPNPVIAKMQQDAEDFERLVLESLPAAHIKHPFVQPEYFEALIDDLYKLNGEKVTDPSFRVDWDQLGDDIDSISWAIKLSEGPRI